MTCRYLGGWFSPGHSGFHPEKRCRQRHITTKRNFPQWFSSGHSGFHVSDEKISKRDHYNLLNNLFSCFRIFCLPFKIQLQLDFTLKFTVQVRTQLVRPAST